MNFKIITAAALLCVGMATFASAEGNYEPFSLSVSVGSNGQTYVGQLPDAIGPQGRWRLPDRVFTVSVAAPPP